MLWIEEGGCVHVCVNMLVWERTYMDMVMYPRTLLHEHELRSKFS